MSIRFVREKSTTTNRSKSESYNHIYAFLINSGAKIKSHNEEIIRFKTDYTFNNYDLLSGIEIGEISIVDCNDKVRISIILNFKNLVKKNFLFTVIPLLLLSIFMLSFFIPVLYALFFGLAFSSLYLLLNLVFLPWKLTQISEKILQMLTEGLKS